MEQLSQREAPEMAGVLLCNGRSQLQVDLLQRYPFHQQPHPNLLFLFDIQNTRFY